MNDYNHMNLDGDILRYRYGFAAQKKDKKNPDVLIVEPERNVITALRVGINCMLNDTGCSDYTVYLSGKGNFRFKVDPDYKIGRKDSVKPYHYENIGDYLIHCCDAVVVDGYEADDALGMAQTDSTIIASIDKDLDQIPGWHYDIVKKNIYYVTEEYAEWWFWMQMLMGDTSDSIIGIKGVGPVKAEKLLADCATDDDYRAVIIREYEKFFGERALDMMARNSALLMILRTEDDLNLQKQIAWDNQDGGNAQC